VTIERLIAAAAYVGCDRSPSLSQLPRPGIITASGIFPSIGDNPFLTAAGIESNGRDRQLHRWRGDTERNYVLKMRAERRGLLIS
jgi:hypothetical protein